MVLVTAMAAQAQAFEVDGLSFTVTSEAERTVEVRSATAGAQEITIPAKVKHDGVTYTVAAIGDAAFRNQKLLYLVEFPDCLTTIGNEAFKNCDQLTFSALPSSLTSIGKEAFRSCQSLTSLILPDHLSTVGEYAFADMAWLASVRFDGPVTELPEGCFNNCSHLSQVNLPATLRIIGDNTFQHCLELETIKLPDSLQSIGDYAFEAEWNSSDDPRPSGIRHITFPKSLRKIGNHAFRHCMNLSSVVFNEGLQEIGEWAFEGIRYMSEIKLPSTLRSVGENAFMALDEVGDMPRPVINLPVSLTKVGDRAFYRPISELTVDAEIDLNGAFVGSVVIMNINGNVKSINADAFGYSESYWDELSRALRLIRIKLTTPPPIPGTPVLTDAECENITVIVPDGCKAAYSRNPRWNKFRLVEESQSIATVHLTGDHPLSEEIRMQSGQTPSKVCRLTVSGHLTDADVATIQGGLPSLYSLDMSGCTNTEFPLFSMSAMPLLRELKLPSKLKTIAAYSLQANPLLTTVTLPETLETIGFRAFDGDVNLQLTKLPESLKCFEEGYEFVNCRSLKSITAGSNFEFMTLPGNDDSFWRGHNFENCNSLETVDFSLGCLDKVPDYCFMNDYNLTTVKLPSTVRSIGRQAFQRTSLENFTWPENLETLDGWAFDGANLRTVNLPDKVKSIRNAFMNNLFLQTITLSKSLESLESEVFEGDVQLSVISCPAPQAPVCSGAFSGLRTSRCSLIVPTEGMRSYSGADGWEALTETMDRITTAIPTNVTVTALDEDNYRNSTKAEIGNGSRYARVFDASTICMAERGSGLRLFLNPAKGYAVSKVLLNGADVTRQMEGNTLFLEPGTSGTLEILSAVSGVEAVEQEDPETPVEYFTLDGLRVSADSLVPGIYIRRQGSCADRIHITN